MKKSIGRLAVALSLAIGTSWVCAAPVTLTFEGLKNMEAVNNFYNGGVGSQGSSGTNYGLSFSTDSLAIIDSDAGGGGNFANEPSASTILFFTNSSAVLNSESGFTGGFSFFYTTTTATATVDVYDGLNKTGNKLGSISLAALGSAGCSGDPTGAFCNWAAAGISFTGIAKSIDFGGTANQVGFDNVTIGSGTPGNGTPEPVPEPGSLLLVGAALLALRAARRG